MIKIGAKAISAASGITSVIAAVCALYFSSPAHRQIVLAFYDSHLREPLFIGLLTVAAFLFSLKTFIIVTMQENVYGTEKYKEKWEEKKKVDPHLQRYAPLENFSLLLFFSILISLSASVLQFTLGLVDTPAAAIISIAAAIWSLVMIFFAISYLQMNLKSWFKFLNDSDNTS